METATLPAKQYRMVDRETLQALAVRLEELLPILERINPDATPDSTFIMMRLALEARTLRNL